MAAIPEFRGKSSTQPLLTRSSAFLIDFGTSPVIQQTDCSKQEVKCLKWSVLGMRSTTFNISGLVSLSYHLVSDWLNLSPRYKLPRVEDFPVRQPQSWGLEIYLTAKICARGAGRAARWAETITAQSRAVCCSDFDLISSQHVFTRRERLLYKPLHALPFT